MRIARQTTHPQSPRLLRAFTLLELLLATAIFAIVLVAINVVFFAGLQLRKVTNANLEAALPLEQALSILRKDLQNVTVPGGMLCGHFRSEGPDAGFGAGFGSSSSRSGTQSTTRPGGSSTPAASTVQGGFDFFTTTGVIRDGVVGGEIQEVNYQLMEPLDPNALGRDLVRSVTRNLLSYTPPIPEEQRLLTNVEMLHFQFYNGYEWRDTWDTSLTETNLPLAVRVQILPAVERKYDSVDREPYQMIVMLPQAGGATSTTNETASAEGGTE